VHSLAAMGTTVVGTARIERRVVIILPAGDEAALVLDGDGNELDQAALARLATTFTALCGTVRDEREPPSVELDPLRRVAVLAGGREVPLGALPIAFRLLEELLAAPEGATKEHLARTVWERRRYEPARDDKRMQMAVRRLRVLIERDPAAPEYLVTTPMGYAITRRPITRRQGAA
jgi:DNA-binding response OmpR family regulator